MVVVRRDLLLNVLIETRLQTRQTAHLGSLPSAADLRRKTELRAYLLFGLLAATLLSGAVFVTRTFQPLETASRAPPSRR
jgi:ABC-type uncharacterized transport system permease subunit